jgi:uncharacterized protein with FMN-binding domain
MTIMKKFLLFCSAVCLVGCSTAYKALKPVTPDLTRKPDGIYEGSYHVKGTPNSATVEVSLENGKITDVTIVKRFASWIGARADKITKSIVAAQSLDVDSISGATSSSKAILMACQTALEGEPETKQ